MVIQTGRYTIAESDLKMSELADFNLANGTLMVVLVYPAKHLLEVRTNNDRQPLDINDTLDGGEVLPGFSMPVKNIFSA
jgi:hypothetical protein